MCNCKSKKSADKKRIREAQKSIEELEKRLDKFAREANKKIEDVLVFHD